MTIPKPEPELKVLDDAQYKRRRDAMGAKPWYTRLFRQYSHGLYHPGKNEVWLRRYPGFQLDSEKTRERLAHEYGHWLGLHHPRMWTLAYWTDLMGGYRIITLTDEHDVMEKAAAWVNRVTSEARDA